MSSIKSSASLFRSSVCEEQDISINCSYHLKPIFSVCLLEKCEFNHLICPKCALERPEHLIAHKNHIELIKDFVSRSLTIDAHKDPEFKKWEHDVEKKIGEILLTTESFEKTLEDVVSRKISVFHERVTKSLLTLQESLKTLLTQSESAALQDLKKKVQTLKTRVNIEKVLNVVDKNRIYEANRNRKEILDSLEIASLEATDIANLNTKLTPIDNLISALMNQFSNICFRTSSLLKPHGNNISDIFLEITRQNAIFEVEMQKSSLKKSSGSATLSNYSSGSTQQRSQENLKESGDKTISYAMEKSPLLAKAKDETKYSNPDLKNRISITTNPIMIQDEINLERRRSQKEGGYLLFFKACEEKINNSNPFFLKTTLTHEELKTFIESYTKANNLKETIPGISYYGEMKNGKKDGYGVDIRNDFVYIGECKDDLPNGKGKMLFKNGDYYDGEWINGKFEGQGKFVLKASAIVYSGRFVQGLKDGFGVDERGDGSRYEGEFKQGQKHGKGIYKWAMGEKYEGEFIENKMHGNGTYVWNDGTVYVGEWKENKLYGNGLLTEGNGGRYLGCFKNDKKEGYGVYTWSDGWIYRGTWKNGVQDGVGTEIDPKGSSRVCQWENGTVIKNLA